MFGARSLVTGQCDPGLASRISLHGLQVSASVVWNGEKIVWEVGAKHTAFLSDLHSSALLSAAKVAFQVVTVQQWFSSIRCALLAATAASSRRSFARSFVHQGHQQIAMFHDPEGTTNTAGYGFGWRLGHAGRWGDSCLRQPHLNCDEAPKHLVAREAHLRSSPLRFRPSTSASRTSSSLLSSALLDSTSLYPPRRRFDFSNYFFTFSFIILGCSSPPRSHIAKPARCRRYPHFVTVFSVAVVARRLICWPWRVQINRTGPRSRYGLSKSQQHRPGFA